MAYLASHLIDHLRKLKGRPMVTFPYDGDTNYPKVERIVNLPKKTWKSDVLTSCNVAPYDQAIYGTGGNLGLKLTDQHETGGDDMYVEVYQAFEVLPGKVITSTKIGEEGELLAIARQKVANGAATATGSLLVESSSVEAGDNAADDVETVTADAYPLLSGVQAVNTPRRMLPLIAGTTRTISRQRVDPSTALSVNYLTLEASKTPLTQYVSRIETLTVDHFDILTNRDRSPKADGLETITTEEVVPAGTEPLPWVYGRVEARCDTADALHSVRVTETLVPTIPDGSAKNITGYARQSSTSGTATILTVTGHGWSTGDSVVITGSGATCQPAINGPFVITVIDADNFSVAAYLVDAAAGGGTSQRYFPEFPVLVDPAEVDKESLILTVTTRQKVVPSTITPGAAIITGSGATANCSISGGQVVATAVTAAGSNYGDIVSVVFGASPTGNTATGYGLASGGQLNSIVLTNPGGGYVIAPAVTIGSSTVMETARKDIDISHAWKIISFVTLSPFNTLATAIKSQREESYPFPGRLDVSLIINTGNSDIGYIRPKSDRIPVTRYRYWVTGDVMPSPPSYDRITTDPSVTIGSVGSFSRVLLDQAYIPYNFGGGLMYVLHPATTPSFRDYMGYYTNVGLMSITLGDTAITGTSTHFSTSLYVGMPAFGSTVASITNDTSATLSGPSTIGGSFPIYERITYSATGVPWLGNKKKPIAPTVEPTRFSAKIWMIEEYEMEMM